MKSNLKLNPSTSLQALEDKARQAVAIASVRRAQTVKKAKTYGGKERATPAETEIRNIFQSLQSPSHVERSARRGRFNTAGPQTAHRIYRLERPSAGQAALAIISVYIKEALDRHTGEEAAYQAALAAGVDRSLLKKPAKPSPESLYAFYPRPGDRSRLGSVAIYCGGAPAVCAEILKFGHIFGHKIVSASVEYGRRAFVDVRLA